MFMRGWFQNSSRIVIPSSSSQSPVKHRASFCPEHPHGYSRLCSHKFRHIAAGRIRRQSCSHGMPRGASRVTCFAPSAVVTANTSSCRLAILPTVILTKPICRPIQTIQAVSLRARRPKRLSSLTALFRPSPIPHGYPHHLPPIFRRTPGAAPLFPHVWSTLR